MLEPFDYDGTDLDCLETFQIKGDKLMCLIKKTEKPSANTVYMIYHNSKSNAFEIKVDD